MSTNHNLNTEYKNSESLVAEESVSPGNWLQKFGPRRSKKKDFLLNITEKWAAESAVVVDKVHWDTCLEVEQRLFQTTLVL
ncbi:hypothetical protein ABKV19_010416 [Rosa sericea]